MEKQRRSINLFIVDDDQEVIVGLRRFLDQKFGNNINITEFNDGSIALRRVNQSTDIVVLDYQTEKRSEEHLIKEIKAINPKTQVIVLSTNENIGIAVDSYRNGANDVALVGVNAKSKISTMIYDVITFPIRLIVREFGVSKFVAIFLLTFITIGVIAVISMQLHKAQGPG
ncbi:MAG: response regulator [Flavobacteriales bacterium]|nr:response regulator [Flavobacteriales bacterium]